MPEPALTTSPPRTVNDWRARVRAITRCRICGNSRLAEVIDLGAQALASLFDDGRWQEFGTPVPLRVVRCETTSHPGACGFLQLTHTVPPEILYQDYGYRSGINTTMRRHLEGLVRELEARIALRAGDLVIDVGANDGTLLLAYRQAGLRRVAFEPSNIRPEVTDHGLVYLPSVFSKRVFRAQFPQDQARVITSIAMFYDLDDPIRFCQELAELLADDGIWVVEMSYLGAMLEHNTFDTICHEHLGYYSLATLRHVVEQAGLSFLDILLNDANGGSVRCYLQHRRAGRPVPSANRRRIERAFQEERERGDLEPARYDAFRRQVQQIRHDVRALLEACRQRGQRVFGYGASTKGNVLLQYCGIGPDDLVAIADRNPAKVGRLTLGTRIPICSEAEMRRARPDHLLVLPWHFLEEFLEREAQLRRSGTKLIVPFPHVRVV